jgi:hypothetical protein
MIKETFCAGIGKGHGKNGTKIVFSKKRMEQR